MRFRLKILYLLITIFFLCYSRAFAWTEPVEIGGGNWLAAPRVAAAGESLYVIAVYPPRAWFLYSLNNGATWSEPVMPIDTSRRIEMPTLKYSKGLLHLVWCEKIRPLYYDLFHSQSSDGGRSWTDPNKVFINSAFRVVAYPGLATNGDSLFIACDVDDNTQLHGFVFFRSFDAGQTWQDSTIIDSDSSFVILQYPKILYSNSLLHFIYPLGIVHDSVGFEIYYRHSTDLGMTWSERIILSPAELFPNTIASQIPSATADSMGRLLVTWMDYANGSMCGISGDIFYRVSLDNGETWEPYGSITNTQSGAVSFDLIMGNKFIVGWDDYWLLGCGRAKEAYSFSTDFGETWETPQFVSGSQAGNEDFPALAYTIQNGDTSIHYLFARDQRLYYMRDRDFVGIDDPDVPNRPEVIGLAAYPNPFNSTISFNYSVPNDDATLEIFNITGQLVRKIKLLGQQGNVIWDSKNEKGGEAASGVYYATLKTGGLKKTIQVTLLR